MPEYLVVDVFTDSPLQGNPLTVYTDARDIPATRMQQIAREMNHSETVFLLPGENGADARVRIFTPATELPFAGHPVLGTAFVLGWSTDTDTLRLQTGAGAIQVVLTRQGDRVVSARMRQPIPTWEPYEHAERLLSALGLGGSELPVEAYRNGPRHVYVGLPGEDVVAALQPDLGSLARLAIGVSCFAGAGERWKTRMFAPALGVPEDPATGSAAGPLAVHLARHGLTAFGQEIEIHQGAEIGRPSTLYAKAMGEGDRVDAVEVAGSAVLVARGELVV